jgi:hypothetical protein
MNEMPKFNHAFDFAFEVITDKPVDDVTPAMLRAALIERANRLSDAELDEACGCFDSFEVE